MSVATRTRAPKLSAYESEQIRRIAAWKSEPPNPLNELWKRVSLPVAREVERLIPDASVRAAIIKAYDVSERLAGQGAIKRRAGVRDLAELKHKPLEECDALAAGVERSAEILALAEGAATGVGGMITTLLDVPLLFVLSLGTIRKIGHCYGHALESHRDVNFVLGVLIAAMAGTPEARRARINRLRELEELLIEEIQEEIFAEEVLSFLFQIEIFAGIPGVGLLSGAALNGLFMRRVCEFARLAFQERWLRENGKVHWIEPAPVAARYGMGWSGALGRVAYSGFYGLGFGAALPVYAVAALVRSGDNALIRGLRDGAVAASDRAEKLTARARGASADGRQHAPALAPG